MSYTFGSHGNVFVNWTVVNISLKTDGGNLSYCTYQTINHTEGAKHNEFTYSKESERFRDFIKVDGEFVRVRCYNSSNSIIYTNFHYFFLPHNNTESRISCENNKVKNLKPNVLMVGIDSLSRINYIRYLKKSRQMMLSMGAVEFVGYNKVADNTFVNLVPVLAGKFAEELPWNENIRHQMFDSFRFIWDDFKEKGFVTFFVEDSPNTAIFDNAKAGFKKNPTDYYNRPMAVAMEGVGEIWFEDHNCVLDKLETDILLEYVSDFVHGVRHCPYFGLVYLSRMTHDYIQGAGAIDDPLHNFFKELYKTGFLKNTIVILFSDHGMRYGEIRNTYIGKLEERLPLLNVMIPKTFSKDHPEYLTNVMLNSRRLTTPFDLHEFLRHILLLDEYRQSSEKGFSLFAEIPSNRTCKSANISAHWCTCSEMFSVQVNTPVVQKISKYFVELLNSKFHNTSVSCANLSLEETMFSYQIKPQDNVLRFEGIENEVLNRKILYGYPVNAIVDYQVTIRTQPGEGVFEGTFRYDEEYSRLNLVGDISRLNKYSDSSYCVQGTEAEKFCYCR
ncbi:uncharacterized protein LOC133197031 [Saccostrea echinata]|uniref:uncharacterized protein LOC133197031 n=1 Tax=Saccostrea echinata TaxID=191078 RepID=UPI002A801858|nr:uncharacterized protein LOC133197031 [Saccostrea echinata]